MVQKETIEISIITKKTKVIYILCFFFLLVILFAVSYDTVITRYSIYKLETANNAEKELDAMSFIGSFSGPGILGSRYSVAVFDENNNQIQPWHGQGEYDEIQYIEIDWENGQSIRKRLIKKGNIGSLLYE